ncbi:hypothetical protein HRG_012129 [Hirsutella rhossiliensis]
MLASGHFSNNQAGQLKVLVVLTSTDVVDKQEPVTPLRPDQCSTPVKEDKKRRVKQEDISPASRRKKRVKQESKSRKRYASRLSTKSPFQLHPARARHATSLDILPKKLLDMGMRGKVYKGVVAEGVEVDEEDREEETSFVPEFVNPESISQAFRETQTRLSDTNAAKALPPAHSTRFKGAKIPTTFAIRYRKRKD